MSVGLGGVSTSDGRHVGPRRVTTPTLPVACWMAIPQSAAGNRDYWKCSFVFIFGFTLL